MHRGALRRVGPLITLAVIWPCGAIAQPFEAAGLRALGMGGAFVAVADDATAVYWNPAGLPTGPVVSLVVHHQTADSVDETRMPPRLQERNGSAFVGLTTLPVGLTYYRLRHGTVVLTPPPAIGRDPSTALASLETHHVGVTLVQSLGGRVTVGTTLKYVRGTARSATLDVAKGPQLLDAAFRLPGRAGHAFDLDAGVMATSGKVRVGLAARNLAAPDFETPSGATLRLDRQVRAGLAVLPSDRMTLALDGDLTRSSDVRGDRRNLALGGEGWMLARRLGLRAGARLNLLDADHPTLTWGGSVFLTRILAVDWQQSGGPAGSDEGWGIGGRVAF